MHTAPLSADTRRGCLNAQYNLWVCLFLLFRVSDAGLRWVRTSVYPGVARDRSIRSLTTFNHHVEMPQPWWILHCFSRRQFDQWSSCSWRPSYPVHSRPRRQAENLLQDILDAGLTPNVVTYTSLMVVLRKSGQYEKAISILKLMRSKVGVGRTRAPRRKSL